MEKNKQKESRNNVVKRQILAIRDTGATNMLDWYTVLDIADKCDFYELEQFIRKDRKKYLSYIISGDDNLLPKQP